MAARRDRVEPRVTHLPPRRAQAGDVGAQAGAGLPTLALLAMAAAALTVWLQGFVFGWSNNLFQVPVVEGWPDEPAFADDSWVQSLRWFASWVWSFAALLAPLIGTENTFLALHLLSRCLLMLTAALLMRELGVRRLAAMATALLALALADGLHRASRVGGHDLYYWFFTHSGMTWPVILLSLLWLSQGRVVLAVASNGVTFGINGFVAASHGVGLAAGALGLMPGDRAGRWRLARRWLAGLGLALLIGLPTFLWFGRMLATQPPAPAGFDGRDFLWNYWPEHFWVSVAPWRDRLWMAVAAASGVLALAILRARTLLCAFLGYVALFAAAGLLPHLTASLTLLNLHPLRISSGLVTMLAAIAVVAATTREVWAGREPATRSGEWRRALAAVALLCTVWGTLKAVLVALAALAAILALRQGWGARIAAPPWLAKVVPGLVVALLLVLVPVQHAHFAADRTARADDAAAMREAGLWLRAHTPPDAMVFVPAAAEPPDSHNIQVWAHRRFWYDWKRGGAVQWSPHYHAEWQARRHVARSLTTVAAALAQACAEGIDYLVETPERMAAAAPPPPGIVFRGARYTVIAVAPSCPAGRAG